MAERRRQQNAKYHFSYVKEKRKVLPELYKAHRAALISVSLALTQTPVYTARPRIQG